MEPFESIARGLSGPARELRGAARPAAAPDPAARGQRLRHPDRADHLAVPRLPRGDAGARPRRRRRLPGDGGDADPHQVAAAAAAPGAGAGTRTKRIRATRWSAGWSSTSSSRPRPRCCTSARPCAARSGRAPSGRLAEIAGEAPEPELEVDLFSLMSAFQAVLEPRQAAAADGAARRAPVDRGAHRAAAGAAVDDRGVRLRGAVRRRGHAAPSWS